MPTDAQYDDFYTGFGIDENVPLATIIDPMASPGEVRKIEIKRGQDGETGGRPRRKTYQKTAPETKELARALRSKGLSLGQIAQQIGVSKSHVQYWTKPTV